MSLKFAGPVKSGECWDLVYKKIIVKIRSLLSGRYDRM